MEYLISSLDFYETVGNLSPQKAITQRFAALRFEILNFRQFRVRWTWCDGCGCFLCEISSGHILLRGDSSHKRSKFKERPEQLEPFGSGVCWHNFESVREYAFASGNMTPIIPPVGVANLQWLARTWRKISSFWGWTQVIYWLRSEISKTPPCLWRQTSVARICFHAPFHFRN